MGYRDVRHTEIHTVEPLVPLLSDFAVKLAIDKLKSHKSPGIDQIPTELITEGGRTIRYRIHIHSISIWNKEESPEEWKELIAVPIHKKENKTDCSDCRAISILPNTYKILTFWRRNFLLNFSTPCI
jgi:hypothetical protein